METGLIGPSTYVNRRRICRLIPGRVEVSDASRDVGFDAVLGQKIGRELADPVVDGVDRLDILSV